MIMNSENIVKTDFRPCLVGDRKALFHKWIDWVDPNVKYIINSIVKQETLNKFKSMINDSNIIPASMQPVPRVSIPMAIVEFEDGSIGEILPTEIKFIDSSGYFNEICWGDKNND